MLILGHIHVLQQLHCQSTSSRSSRRFLWLTLWGWLALLPPLVTCAWGVFNITTALKPKLRVRGKNYWQFLEESATKPPQLIFYSASCITSCPGSQEHGPSPVILPQKKGLVFYRRHWTDSPGPRLFNNLLMTNNRESFVQQGMRSRRHTGAHQETCWSL